jgi:hypothetical protein
MKDRLKDRIEVWTRKYGTALVLVPYNCLVLLGGCLNTYLFIKEYPRLTTAQFYVAPIILIVFFGVVIGFIVMQKTDNLLNLRRVA